MVKFFEAMKNQNDPEQEQKMRQVLYGGRGDIKRHYAVDEKLYGTEEGAKLAEEAQRKTEVAVKMKQKKKQRKTSDSNKDEIEAKRTSTSEDTISDRSAIKNVATGMLAIGVLGGLSLLIGGKRSQ
jgi:hypothetical protein